MSNPTKPDPLLDMVLRLPRFAEVTVPPEYIDYNGHMNVMHYTGVANIAVVNFFTSLLLDEERLAAQNRGFFALRQVISYLSEIREGERIAVHSGLIGYDRKRLHFIHYIVNLDKMRVASTDERVAMHIDLNVRRSTEFDPALLEELADARARYAALDWQPELSGAIQLKPL